MGAFIEAENVCKIYRVGEIEVRALRGISFTVRRGEFVSVVGPSGSGKSTLFYVLGGLTRADSGRIVIDGDDLSQLSDAELTNMRKRKTGFVFQRFNLLPMLDARSNRFTLNRATRYDRARLYPLVRLNDVHIRAVIPLHNCLSRNHGSPGLL